jgi:hypothetical protein
MANSNPHLIAALRRVAHKLQQGAPYQWGHMGSCNCGNLAQELTHYSKDQIHTHALAVGRGDWNEQLNDYCPSSGLHMDTLIGDMLEYGLTVEDLKHLEKLSDRHVLACLPDSRRNLRRNFRDDVVLYMLTWADLLETKAIAQVELPAWVHQPEPVNVTVG